MVLPGKGLFLDQADGFAKILQSPVCVYAFRDILNGVPDDNL